MASTHDKFSAAPDLSVLFFKDHRVENDNPTTFAVEAPFTPAVKKLNWDFHGLSLWLELEEYESDITNAIGDLAIQYQVEKIPKSHTTAIYGMTHLTTDTAIQRLHAVKNNIPVWPTFASPSGVVSDIAVCGRPGQVCSIAWCELTLSSNDEHEKALDALYSVFFDDLNDNDGGSQSWNRHRPWKPHNSIAYDNPEDTTFSLQQVVKYIAEHPSLVMNERRVEAISLWDTNGRMEDWKCLDRVYF